MFVEMNSMSSGLMFGTTIYRNQSGSVNKLIAQAGYVLTAVVALVETVVALTFSALTFAMYSLSRTPFEYSFQWLNSSAFCLGWSVADIFLNLFANVLVADERSARQIFQNGNLLVIPQRAVIKVSY